MPAALAGPSKAGRGRPRLSLSCYHKGSAAPAQTAAISFRRIANFTSPATSWMSSLRIRLAR